MQPSRQTPSSLSQRVQRQSEFEVVGLGFALLIHLDGAGWREGKGVGILNAPWLQEQFKCHGESELVRPPNRSQIGADT